MALIVLCHPCKVSLNSSVKETIKMSLESLNHEIFETTLYEDIENIRIKSEVYILNEIEKLRNSFLVVFQYPTYFASFPALLLDYLLLLVDKDPECFAEKKVLLSSTFGGLRSDYVDSGCRGSLDFAMKPLLNIVFGSSGCELLQPIQFFRDEYEIPSQYSVKIDWIKQKIKNIDSWPLKTLKLEHMF